MNITYKDVCIIIPIYKDNITKSLLYDEVESIYHTCELFKEHDIYFICSEKLNTSFYKRFNCKFKYFEFSTQLEYSQLCLNYLFYNEFINYKYMLICQPDAYVFKNNILDWCNKGYDYVGALILFDDNMNPIFGDENINIHGYKNVAFNGGLSLRNIQNFYNVCLKYKNELKDETMHEDMYICFKLNDNLKITTIDDAIKFSAENQTYCIYPKVYNELPFGCHMLKVKYKLFDIFNIKI